MIQTRVTSPEVRNPFGAAAVLRADGKLLVAGDLAKPWWRKRSSLLLLTFIANMRGPDDEQKLLAKANDAIKVLGDRVSRLRMPVLVDHQAVRITPGWVLVQHSVTVRARDTDRLRRRIGSTIGVHVGIFPVTVDVDVHDELLGYIQAGAPDAMKLHHLAHTALGHWSLNGQCPLTHVETIVHEIERAFDNSPNRNFTRGHWAASLRDSGVLGDDEWEKRRHIAAQVIECGTPLDQVVDTYKVLAGID